MEQTYYIIILGALLFEFILSTLSSVLNMKSISKVVPDGFQDYYDEEKYAKSQLYLQDKTKLGLISSTFSLLLILSVIYLGLFGKLDEFVRSNSTHYVFSGLLFFGVLFFINDILNLPFSLYSTFVIEEKYGFNKTSINTFITDKFKGYGLVVVLGSAVMTPILYFFNTFQENAWWIAWFLITAFMIAVQPLFVHVIAPMFNKFSPLEDGELKTAIEEFANKVSFPIGRIDIMDGSKRSSHSNAYFSGFGKSRRIALFDTLLAKLSTAEIVSVVAHDIGHSNKKHIIAGTILGIIYKGINVSYFRKILDTAIEHQKNIDKKVNKSLMETWKLPRIDPTIRAIFRIASSEFIIKETPSKVIINEYVKLAEAFSTNDKQRGIVNAVLENLAKQYKT